MRRVAWLAVVTLLIVPVLWSQAKIEKAPAPYTSPSSGKEMFKAYCASCHGVDGKGGGPAATAMKASVPDLTLLAKKGNGKFPADHVAQVIRGDVNSPAHGSAEMPIWGPVFLNVSQHQPGQVHQRIKNLVQYIEANQAK